MSELHAAGSFRYAHLDFDNFHLLFLAFAVRSRHSLDARMLQFILRGKKHENWHWQAATRQGVSPPPPRPWRHARCADECRRKAWREKRERVRRKPRHGTETRGQEAHLASRPLALGRSLVSAEQNVNLSVWRSAKKLMLPVGHGEKRTRKSASTLFDRLKTQKALA